MNKTLQYLGLIILSLFFLSGSAAIGQEEDAESGSKPVDFILKYWKKSSGNYELSVNVTAEGEDGYYPVTGIPINFMHLTDSNSILLDIVDTDGEGNAVYQITPNQIVYKDTAGLFGLAASFDGNAEYDAAYEETYVKDVILTMTLEVVDSVKTVFVTAHYVKGDGVAYPINDQDIYLYKQGLYSWLQIGDGWLIDGECEIEFPENLPGDKDGNVELHLAITEHFEYGNVEVQETIDWGRIPDFITSEDGKLWTSGAPTWMIVLLIILLSGVWGHYVYAMIQMWRIKKASQ